MKVLLYSNYGSVIPKEMLRKITSRTDYCSLEFRSSSQIIEKLENLCTTSIGNMSYDDIEQWISTHKGEVFSSGLGEAELSVKYSYVMEKLKEVNVVSFTIQEVDTSRPWTIEEYDGAEYIKYLDGYELVDSECNYYKKKASY